MKTAGIIVEYNPFHNGHQYQIEQLRAKTDADYIVVAMSGNFLQRGIPSITDKYVRTQMALLGGADLVLEIPSIWATASAERFADAGVRLLASTGIIDTIGYGAEQPDADLMHALVGILCNPADSYHSTVQALQRNGLSYPAAREQALCAQFSKEEADCVHEFISSPNNILALEYEKAIAQYNSSHDRLISGYGIQRIGGGYHDEKLQREYSSAFAIRNVLFSRAASETSIFSMLTGQLPQGSLELLSEAASHNALMNMDDFSEALYLRLWTYRNGYTQFADCNKELSCKIQNRLNEYTSFSSFASLLKTREVTYTRICRVLIHILLGITKEDYTLYSSLSECAYLRVLGFRRSSAPLLSAIKKEASLPLVTKMADASQYLSSDAMSLLSQDIAAADLYRSIRSIRNGVVSPNEFTQPLVIL